MADLDASVAELNYAFERISFYSNISMTVESADLVIEAIPEVVSV